jgi:hypothetical protein
MKQTTFCPSCQRLEEITMLSFDPEHAPPLKDPKGVEVALVRRAYLACEHSKTIVLPAGSSNA